ncbi:MAG: hypothetical protein DI537_49090 [Stutzerimonas stutzeri]|nr:MAG: hypothetical protein DI537_49090 [Stutzerimonas stutzeri]
MVEDMGRHIVLQHLLVVPGEGDKAMVIKHWRQDWTYEPATVLVYAGKGKWTLEDVPAAFRRTRYAERFPMQGAIYRSSSL